MPRKNPPTLRDLRDGIGRPTPPPPMTQAQAAIAANVNQSYLSQIERGRQEPTARVLWRLAIAYGISYEFILECAAETMRQAPAKRKQTRTR